MIDSVSDAAGGGDDFKRRRKKSLSELGASSLDRLPPHDLQMEMGVIGCVMLSPRECLSECVTTLKDSGKDAFYDVRHQYIYETLVKLFEAGKPIDIITVQQDLKDRQLLEQIGGISYLSQIQDSVPSAANLSYYLGVVKEKYLLRLMIQTCSGVVGRIYDYEGEVDALLDEVEKEVLKVGDLRRGSDDIKSAKELVNDSITEIEGLFNRKGAIGGIPTGFPDFDKMTDGLTEGMYVIAARPSMGKTSFACNIAEHIVLESKLPVGIFSLEMSAASLMLRINCSAARVNLRLIRDGFMNGGDFSKLMTSSGKLSVSKLWIDDTAGLSINQLRARARRMVQRYGIRVLVIDYLQLLHSTNRKAKSRQEEIADISSGLKSLSKELHIPIIVLAQLNRDIERDNKGTKKRKPRMSDLRESGSLEQDADLVGLLYKPNVADDDEESDSDSADGIAVNLLIAKQRNGPTGDVCFTFLKGITRFESAAKFSNEDVPDGR